VIGHTTFVGVVLLNRQSRIVIEKPIEDVRRLARGHCDHLGVERPELVGDVGSERHAGLVAMVCIHVPIAVPLPPTRKYCPSDDDVCPAPHIEATGSARCASISLARAA
jgi:hypothetical protein